MAAVFGVAWLVRRRALGPLLFVASSLLALWYVTRTGSPWADGKALAIASPAVLLAATLGPVALESLGARAEAALVALALVGSGCSSRTRMAYHDVSLAPQERLEELADVGERTAGRGPLLYTEFEEFGKHFLRDSQPVGASEGFTVEGLSPQLVDGGRPPFATNVRLASLALPDVQRFNLIVTRRGPDGERPPVNWRREWSGRWYEIWRRGGSPAVRAQTDAAPRCRRRATACAADERWRAARRRLCAARGAARHGWASAAAGLGPGRRRSAARADRRPRHRAGLGAAHPCRRSRALARRLDRPRP